MAVVASRRDAADEAVRGDATTGAFLDDTSTPAPSREASDEGVRGE